MKTGRPTIFGRKDGDRPYQALALTKRGQLLFERTRKWLAKLVGRETVSDGDVIESLVRGEDETIRVVEKQKP
jgi:hypothetical protein